MEPNMTLHWFVHPQWFSDMGAFKREENIPVFVDFAKKAFELFGTSFCSILSSAKLPWHPWSSWSSKNGQTQTLILNYFGIYLGQAGLKLHSPAFQKARRIYH